MTLFLKMYLFFIIFLIASALFALSLQKSERIPVVVKDRSKYDDKVKNGRSLNSTQDCGPGSRIIIDQSWDCSILLYSSAHNQLSAPAFGPRRKYPPTYGIGNAASSVAGNGSIADEVANLLRSASQNRGQVCCATSVRRVPAFMHVKRRLREGF